ncbi:MAG: hypothetical protein QM662_02545 [Gordonia sp. (in: high G+C Gram-positive bacteria)]
MMAKDRRLYGRFDIDFPDNPKIMPLSDAAFRCLVEATLWSRKQLTDGFLASRYAAARWGVEVLMELATNDPSRPSLVEVEGGWLIHDFVAHQDTRAEVEARSRRNKLNGQKGGQAKAKRLASESLSENVAKSRPDADERQDSRHAEMRHADDARHDATSLASDSPSTSGNTTYQLASESLSENVAETETETYKRTPSSTASMERYPAVFEQWWSVYPRKVGKGAAAKAFAKVDIDIDRLMDVTRRYAESVQDSEARFIPHPATWLNQSRFDDDQTETPTPIEFLRHCWQSGDIVELKNLTGCEPVIRWPDDTGDNFDRVAWVLSEVRRWIDEEHENLTQILQRRFSA